MITSAITSLPAAKVGCATRLLGRDKAHPAIYYAWLVCVGPPDQGNVSEPVKATIDATSRMASLQLPSDTNYAADVTRMFPSSVRDQIVHQRGIDATTLMRDARRAQPQR